MFAGIIQSASEVLEADHGTGAILHLTIRRPETWHDQKIGLAIGDSVAVNGCCLTIVRIDSGNFRFDVMPETLARTTLGGFRAGRKVNLERALRMGDPIGGHLVQGHVDAVGEVLGVEPGADYRVRVSLPRRGMESVTPKGCVTIDGVSLTVAAVHPDSGWFEVALIPETLRVTTLSTLRRGDRVNIETDAMVRAVLHWQRHYGPGTEGGATP